MPAFTENQQNAIFHSGHNLLVSASAGSGKTTVLVQRIIQKVIAGINLDDLLVVTFTEAAAAEMRDRIRHSLENAVYDQSSVIAKNHNQEFRQQLNRLDSAQISTLHAFCLQVIHKFYYLIDLDPSFRLLTDQTELELLKEQTWMTIRDAHYDKNDPAFFDLAEHFGSDRSDSEFQQTVFKLYGFAITRPNGQQWLKDLGANYHVGATLEQSSYFEKWLLPFFCEQLRKMDELYSQLLAAINLITDVKSTMFDEATTNQAKIRAVLTQKVVHYADIRQALEDQTFSRFTVKGKKYSDEQLEREQVSAIRNQIKTYYQQELLDDYFFTDESNLLIGQRATEKTITNLAQVVIEYMQAYVLAKRKLKVLDFNDLEQITWQLLQVTDGSDHPVQSYYQQRFREVLVDEYQDINPLQEAILQSVSHDQPGNMFMVGDVKQSIYGFRQADPSKFIAKYNSYEQSPDPKSANESNELIILAENFRSTKNINDSTNFIFQQIMAQDTVELEYDKQAQLITGAADYPADLDTATEVLFFETNETGTDNSFNLKSDDTTDSEEADLISGTTISKTAMKIKILINRINQLIAAPYQIYDRGLKTKRPITYADIALLVPTRSNNLEIVTQLQQANIPVYVSDANNYFQTTEIRVMLAFLSIINNPEQDIPLVTVLRSPIGNFDENDLARIRGQQQNVNFYCALKNYHFDKGNDQTLKKTTDFLTLLNSLRGFTVQHRISELVWEIYQQTGYLDYVGGMPGGLQRSLNLHALYQRAYSYEQTSLKGLYQFVTFIEQMQTHEQDLAQAKVGDSNQNAIQLMTIHGSKGLEFPIVFMLDIDHNFNLRDVNQSKIVLDAHYGAGIKYLDTVEKIKYPTLIDSFIRTKHHQALIAEEMRKLYVGLTRAKQKLILIGTIKDWQSSYQNFIVTDPHIRTKLPESLRDPVKMRSFIDMLLPTILRSSQLTLIGTDLPIDDNNRMKLKENKAEFLIHLYHITDFNQEIEANLENSQETSKINALDGRLKTTIQQLLNFNYPFQKATETTAYQSVSEIKQAFADPDQLTLSFLPLGDKIGGTKRLSRSQSQQSDTTGRFNSTDYAQPKFMMPNEEVTGAQVGTATHLLLQKIDLKKAITEKYLKSLRDELITQGLVQKNVAKKINLAQIISFFGTELGKKMQLPIQKVAREVPFSLLLPADSIFSMDADHESDRQKLLVHGIIDGYFITKQGVTLFDYKTDYVADDDTKANQLATLTNQYRGQLHLYAQALTSILQLPIEHEYLYFLNGHQLIDLKNQS